MSDISNVVSGFSFEKVLFVFPEIINAILLSTGAFQIYNGIEIAHPVYQAFCSYNFYIVWYKKFC